MTSRQTVEVFELNDTHYVCSFKSPLFIRFGSPNTFNGSQAA